MNTFCRYFNEKLCTSCTLLSTDYSTQVKSKEQALKKALSEIDQIGLEQSVFSPEKAFRNKAKFTVTGTIHSPVIGLIGEDDLDQGRELLSCPLHVNQINEMLPVLKEFIQLANLTPYQIAERKGELKGIIIFHSKESNETYLRFVCRSKEPFDRIKKHKNFLLEKFPSIKCISLNIQPIPHAILEGDEEMFVTPQTHVRNKSGTVEYLLDPRAFVQTNQLVAQELYSTAAYWIKELKTKKFLELFCGQGAFSFFCADSIEVGLGIEINKDAVSMANASAVKMGLRKLSFKASDASSVEQNIKDFSPDLILVNPPRRGIGKATELLIHSTASYVVYSSCNYESLASDLKKLNTNFKIKKVQLFDMFPHTSHFETLVLLERII